MNVSAGQDAHGEQSTNEAQDGHELILHASSHGISDVISSALNRLRQHADGFLLQNVQRDLGAVEVLVSFSADETGRCEVEFGLQGRAETYTGGPVAFGRVWKEPDAARLGGDGDDELVVHHEASGSGRLQVNADEDAVEALAQHAGKVLVVDGVQELGLVEVAAQGVSDTRVAVSAQSAVKLQRVMVELTQFLLLRKLHDVHTSAARNTDEIHSSHISFTILSFAIKKSVCVSVRQRDCECV